MTARNTATLCLVCAAALPFIVGAGSLTDAISVRAGRLMFVLALVLLALGLLLSRLAARDRPNS